MLIYCRPVVSTTNAVSAHLWDNTAMAFEFVLLLPLLRIIGIVELMLMLWRLSESTPKIKSNVRIEEIATIHFENIMFRCIFSNILIDTNASSGTYKSAFDMKCEVRSRACQLPTNVYIKWLVARSKAKHPSKSLSCARLY